jgi:hypothetical protein
MRDINEVFDKLAKSKFRSRFRLKAEQRGYVNDKSIETIVDHARRFINQRLAPAEPKNDGKQTPFKGHPVFIAQHATATCCRGCLIKWHNIPKGQDLSNEQIEYVVEVVRRWIELQMLESI